MAKLQMYTSLGYMVVHVQIFMGTLAAKRWFGKTYASIKTALWSTLRMS